jgi:hypothetical protein
MSRKPQEISVDGGKADLPVEGHGDEWVLLAPRGKHIVEVRTLTATGLAVTWWSEVWAWAITLLGATAILFMLRLYFRVRLHPADAWRRPV